MDRLRITTNSSEVEPDQEQSLGRAVTLMWRMKAGALLVSALAIAVLTPFTLGFFATLVKDKDLSTADLPGFAAFLLEKPLAGCVLAVPAIVFAVLALTARRLALLWLILGIACLGGAVLTVILVFVGLLSPMYQYQPL